MRYLIAFAGAILLLSCQKETSKEDIIAIEKQFEKKCKESGIAIAFYEFAADDAVIKRENDSLIKGKEAIKNYYSNPKYSKATVTWKPDFINVSDDGTRAYTYGKYVWTASDSLGSKKEFKGVFHTVWKKQKDGNWKYVWD